MPDGIYRLKDVDGFFRARLQEEAKKVFATDALTRIYEAAVSKVPEVRFTVVGGARAHPRLGRVGEYKKFCAGKGLRTSSAKPNGEPDTASQQQDPAEQSIDAEAYRTMESEILRLFSNRHTHSDYDLAAVVVNDDVRREDEIIPKLIDEIKVACQDASLRSSVQDIEASLGVTLQDLLDKDKLKRIYDVREGFVFGEKDFLDMLKTYPQIWETFRSDKKDISDVVTGKSEGNAAIVKVKSARIEVRVANLRREKGALVALIEPANGPTPYLQETLDDGALVVVGKGGNIRAEIWNAIKEIDDLQENNKSRIRKLPQGWRAFVDYANILEELGLLTNGLAAAKVKYEELASTSN